MMDSCVVLYSKSYFWCKIFRRGEAIQGCNTEGYYFKPRNSDRQIEELYNNPDFTFHPIPGELL